MTTGAGRSHPTIALLVAGLLTACGGGSGGNSNVAASPPSPPPLDQPVNPTPDNRTGAVADDSTARVFHGISAPLSPALPAGSACTAADPTALVVATDCSRVTGWRLGPQQIHVTGATPGVTSVQVVPQRHWASFAGDAGSRNEGLTLVTAPNGQALTWGGNWGGLLGRNELDFFKLQPLPRPVLAQGSDTPLADVMRTAVSANSALALTADGRVWIWGDPYFAVSDAKVVAGAIPMARSAAGGPVDRAVGLATAFGAYAAVLDDGAVLGWGIHAGTGEESNTRYPTPVLTEAGNPLTGIRTIAGGWWAMFALDAGGRVWAWGRTQSPSNDEQKRARTLKKADGTDLTDIVSIATGGGYLLAIDAQGRAHAAGDNRSGQLGQGNTTAIPGWTVVPVRDAGGSGLLSNIAMLAGGSHAALALDRDGRVWAWGHPWSPVIGCGTSCNYDSTEPLAPRPVASETGGGQLAGVVAIAANSNHALALKADGSVLTWGMAGAALGQGTIDARRTSTPVAVKDEAGTGVLRLDPAAYPNLLERFR